MNVNSFCQQISKIERNPHLLFSLEVSGARIFYLQPCLRGWGEGSHAPHLVNVRLVGLEQQAAGKGVETDNNSDGRRRGLLPGISA